jgi:hypothetical protein
MEPYAIRGFKDRIVLLKPGDVVIGAVTDKEFKRLFGFVPAVDIKLTPQQDKKLVDFLRRRKRRK